MEHSLTVDYRLAFVRGYFMLKWLLFPFLRYLSTFEWLVCNYREKYLSPMLLAWASRLQFSRGHVQGTNIVTMQVVVLLSLVGTCSLISFFFLPQTRIKILVTLVQCMFVYLCTSLLLLFLMRVQYTLNPLIKEIVLFGVLKR